MTRRYTHLGPEARIENGHELAPHGFYATAPGMIAANLKRSGGMDFGNDGLSFVMEYDDQYTNLWIYAALGTEVCVELPYLKTRSISLVFDDKSTVQSTLKDGVLSFRLPGKVSEIKYLWHAASHND